MNCWHEDGLITLSYVIADPLARIERNSLEAREGTVLSIDCPRIAFR